MTDLVSLPDIQSQLQAQAETRVPLDAAYRIVQQVQAAYEADRIAAEMSISELDALVVRLNEQTASLQAKLAVATADVHVSVGAEGVVSRTLTAVSFIEKTPIWTLPNWPAAKASLARCAGAFKVHMKDFGALDPWPDPTKPNLLVPDPANPEKIYQGNRLPLALRRIREIDPVAPIILTLYGAPWWMKSAGDVPLTLADAYSDSGRVRFERLPDWLLLVDAAVALAAGFGCRDFEVWNECKGYYTSAWDMSMTGQAGKPMGYTYFYKATAAQIEATMTRLGIARADYRIAAPYAVYATRGDKTADALPDTHPLSLNAAKYGYIQKQAVNATTDFLRNARDNHLTVNALALDASTYLKSGTYPSTNSFDYIQKFEDLCVWIESVLITYGFDPNMDKIFSELYPTPDPTHQTADSEQLRAALWAEALRICVLRGVRFPIMWGPTSPAGGFYHELGALVDANGALLATGRVFKLFKDSFPVGTKVYPLVCSDARVGGLASADTVVVWNRTAAPLTVAIDDKVTTLAANEVREVSR